ncbi:MAG: hypothetical protein C4538_11820 [Nitrospiraceae bacterium]|nr:MAG: hypothetical protein C4538_11820 [Nitrospiraceae bacterium]
MLGLQSIHVSLVYIMGGLLFCCVLTLCSAYAYHSEGGDTTLAMLSENSVYIAQADVAEVSKQDGGNPVANEVDKVVVEPAGENKVTKKNEVADGSAEEKKVVEKVEKNEIVDDEGEEDDEDEEDENDTENKLGKEMYDAYCARCHGFKGDGKGEASNFTYPRPRDFTSGMFKFRSTPSGEPPTDDDLKLVILRGVPGTSMFGWEGKFSDEDIDALIEYMKSFDEETFELEGESVELGKPPLRSDELIAAGKELFQKAKCWECHGKHGRGDGEKGWQPDFKDDWGNKIWPTNLTYPWELRNGATLEDLHRSIATGLDGTPMASFYDSYSEENRWALSYYLLSIQVWRKLDSILAIEKTDRLPSSPVDDLWNKADYTDLKIEGKKVFGIPFISLITNMRVRGVYTNSHIAIMLEWDDKKPDKGNDGFPPDAVRLQFPSARNLVNIWYWNASDGRAVEFNASGQQINDLIRQERSDIQAVSNYDDGIYRLMFTRPLATGDSNDITFFLNRHIPFSVIAYDGKNNEQGERGAMSAVRYIMLKP